MPVNYYWLPIMPFKPSYFFELTIGSGLFLTLFSLYRFAKVSSILLVLMSWFCHSVSAQTTELPTQYGVIAYQDVVKSPNLGKTMLFNNALNALGDIKIVNQKKIEDNLSTDTISWVGTTIGGFLVYHLKSPFGEVRYSLTIEIKDERYRYTFTDFVFYPYSRNRYGKFERDKWVSKPLEEPKLEGHQKQWERTKEKTAEKVAALVFDLRITMAEIPTENVVSPQVVLDDDW